MWRMWRMWRTPPHGLQPNPLERVGKWGGAKALRSAIARRSASRPPARGSAGNACERCCAGPLSRRSGKPSPRRRTGLPPYTSGSIPERLGRSRRAHRRAAHAATPPPSFASTGSDAAFRCQLGSPRSRSPSRLYRRRLSAPLTHLGPDGASTATLAEGRNPPLVRAMCRRLLAGSQRWFIPHQLRAHGPQLA